jgi:5-(aminomethyl)-3-furanmethanol phosphate kinase
MSRPFAVVKVGGSLFDLPDLATRLRRWLAAEWSSTNGILLLPGGGPAVDVVRALDRWHKLGEEASHWLALRALTLNAHFLTSLLPSACAIDSLSELPHIWDKGNIPILNAHEFARADEDNPGRLPHTWAVTSDAVAARVAIVTHARHLVLLKSATIPPDVDWREAGQRGLVDEMFAEVLRHASRDLRTRAVNLRTWSA